MHGPQNDDKVTQFDRRPTLARETCDNLFVLWSPPFWNEFRDAQLSHKRSPLGLKFNRDIFSAKVPNCIAILWPAWVISLYPAGR